MPCHPLPRHPPPVRKRTEVQIDLTGESPAKKTKPEPAKDTEEIYQYVLKLCNTTWIMQYCSTNTNNTCFFPRNGKARIWQECWECGNDWMCAKAHEEWYDTCPCCRHRRAPPTIPISAEQLEEIAVEKKRIAQHHEEQARRHTAAAVAAAAAVEAAKVREHLQKAEAE